MNFPDQAETYYLKALALEEKTYGHDSWNVQGTLEILAEFYESIEQPEKAKDFQAKAETLDAKLVEMGVDY